ncbi:MAG: nucleotidyltransferase domain-containing protein [Bacteroidia bacterium]|nr:nucleotidyltransferase domain-containing protein [Bacteroidia bacterium]
MRSIRPLPSALSTLLKRLCQEHGWQVYIFGSWARNETQPTDIDIAIQAESPPTETELAELRWQIEELPIPYRVDIVRYDTADPELQAAIRREGILWKPEST